jgi:hypothetical protein
MGRSFTRGKYLHPFAKKVADGAGGHAVVKFQALHQLCTFATNCCICAILGQKMKNTLLSRVEFFVFLPLGA